MALIGAQMYTLRDYCKTPADIARSCERVKAMGYDGIQASSAGFATFDLKEVKQIRKALDDNGLVCAATHEGLRDADDDRIKTIIEKHRILDCKLTAIGGFFPKDEWTVALWQNFIKDYNAIAKKFAAGGLRIGYHNHSHELAPLENGRTPLAMLLEKLDPSLWFEIDVYWIAHGLGDPAQWIDKVAASGKGRIPAVHYKDGIVNSKREHKMMPIGTGNLNWPRINKACAAAGVEWYLVERDSGDHDPFDALEISIKNMRAMGL